MRSWLCLGFLLCACRGEAPAAAPPPPPRAPSPAEALDQLDGRKALPLLPMMANHQKQNMREHLVAVREVTAGLAANDFARVEQAAARLGTSPQMGQMCEHLGRGAAGFTEQALAFHQTADTIAEAARAKDQAKTLAALEATLSACTACHDAWKQQLVDEPTWKTAAAAAATQR